MTNHPLPDKDSAEIVQQRLKDRSLDRIAQVFSVDKADLRLDHVFGEDLKPSFVSDFRRNELDILNDDVLDVSDRSTLKDIRSGKLVLKSVGDYCDHIIKCYETNKEEVCSLLGVDVADEQ